MFYWLFQQFNFARKALPGRGDSARQLAFGVALGLMLGLIPKGNLTAVGLSFVIFASTANLGTAMITATAISLTGTLFDPQLHRIGEWVLMHPPLKPYWIDLYQQPIAPWTQFNNTVVMGGFVAGLILFVPAYRLSRSLFEQYWIKTANVTEQVDEEPVRDAPVDDAPVDEEPVDEEPVDDAPVDEEPVDGEPVALVGATASK